MRIELELALRGVAKVCSAWCAKILSGFMFVFSLGTTLFSWMIFVAYFADGLSPTAPVNAHFLMVWCAVTLPTLVAGLASVRKQLHRGMFDSLDSFEIFWEPIPKMMLRVNKRGYSEKRVEFLWRKMHELCKTRLHRDFPAGNKNMISRFPHDIPLSHKRFARKFPGKNLREGLRNLIVGASLGNFIVFILPLILMGYLLYLIFAALMEFWVGCWKAGCSFLKMNWMSHLLKNCSSLLSEEERREIERRRLTKIGGVASAPSRKRRSSV